MLYRSTLRASLALLNPNLHIVEAILATSMVLWLPVGSQATSLALLLISSSKSRL
ncbi:MAG: hypothetical protein QW756_06940 [Nitrososphaerota archaeon]